MELHLQVVPKHLNLWNSRIERVVETVTLPEVKVKAKKARKWLWIGLAALAALQIYLVQELLAAMVIFSVLFAVIAIVALVIYLVERAGEQTLKWAEPQTHKAAEAARKALVRAEEISKKQLHRQRSETAP
jgi:fatty acid desaturase